MCPGMRFAQMEMMVAAAKLIQNYRLEWAGEGRLGPRWAMFNAPDQPLKFKFHRV